VFSGIEVKMLIRVFSGIEMELFIRVFSGIEMELFIRVFSGIEMELLIMALLSAQRIRSAHNYTKADTLLMMHWKEADGAADVKWVFDCGK
jgi:hypothetical protein